MMRQGERKDPIGNMFPIPLKPGLFMELEARDGDVHAHYLSRILSLDADAIQVSYPRSLNGQQIPIAEGAKFYAGVVTESGNYGFPTTVLSVQETPERSISLGPPTDVYTWERQYLRLDAKAWVRYRTIHTLEVAGVKQPSRRGFTTTLNISGGGLLLHTGEELTIGTLMELEIDIPTADEPILALGRVVHGYGGHGVEFLLIDEPDREVIIRYIFEAVRQARSCCRTNSPDSGGSQ